MVLSIASIYVYTVLIFIFVEYAIQINTGQLLVRQVSAR